MRNRLYWILAITLVLGMGVVLGAGLVTFGGQTQIVQAAAVLLAENRNAGILVGAVMADSPAAQAGLVRGDIIVEVNGTALDANNPAATLLKGSKVGDILTLKVLHGDNVLTVKVTLADQNGTPYLGILPAYTNGRGFGDLRKTPAGNGQVPEKGTSGAHVVEVLAGGPAEKAGIKLGDTILKLNDQVIDANNDLAKVLAAFKPGASIQLNVQRKGETAALDLPVTLGENPAKAGQAYLGIKYQMLGDSSTMPKSQTPGQPQNPRIQAGLVVTEVKTGSPAEKAGLKAKDVITEVNARAVTNADDFVKQVQSAKVGDKLTLTVTRTGEANPLKIEVVLGANPDKSDQAYLGVSVSGKLRGFPGGMPNGGPGGRSRSTPQLQGSNS